LNIVEVDQRRKDQGEKMNARWMVYPAFFAGLILSSQSSAAEGNWKKLSNEAWRGFKRQDFPHKGWTIDQGGFKTIVGGDQVDIITKQKYRNFELELEWKVSPGGNGGIFYRASEADSEVWHTAPEIQVLDDARHNDGKNAKTSAGSLYALIAPTGKKLAPVGEFNKFRLIVRGNHVEHWLNGSKVVEYELGSDSLKALIAESKFSDKPRFGQEREGHIGLQHHGQEVWYRNIRILELP
jgi:hypothetical protein